MVMYSTVINFCRYLHQSDLIVSSVSAAVAVGVVRGLTIDHDIVYEEPVTFRVSRVPRVRRKKKEG